MREERFIESAIRKALGRQSPGPASPCPDENLLAAYMERSLSSKERSCLENHIAECASCQEVLALAMKVAGEAELPVAGIGTSRERKLLFRFSVPLAAMAVLVLGVGMATLFLLTREFRKPERAEIAQQVSTEAVPSSSETGQGRPESSTVPNEPMKPSAVSRPPGQALRTGGAADRMISASEKKAGPQEQPGSAEYPHQPVPEGKLSKTDSIASNEEGNMPAAWKGESNAGAAAKQAADKAVTGGFAGGVVGGILPPSSPAAEPAVAEAEPQKSVVTQDYGGVRTKSADRETSMAKSRRASLSMAQSPAAESRLRDVIQRVAADEKAGKRSDSGTRAIGGRIFTLNGGFWVDLKCINNPDADLVECRQGSAEFDEILKAVPGLDVLSREGLPILLDWNGRICIIR